MSQTERAIHDLDTKAIMPLTEVSIEYGTDGLLSRLQRALGGLALEEHEQVLIQDSLELALDLHKDDKRTYEPYANHLLRVALRLIENLEVKDAVTIAASLLHDSIEDHAKELAERFLDREIPDDPHVTRELGALGLRAFAARYEGAEDLADIVLDVSNPILEEDEDKGVVYVEHVGKIMYRGLTPAKLIKIADLFDNTDVPEGIEDPAKRRRLDKKQLPVYPLVEVGLTDPEVNVPDLARNAMVRVLRRNHHRAIRRVEGNTELKSA